MIPAVKQRPSKIVFSSYGELFASVVAFYFCIPYWWFTWGLWPLAYIICGGLLLGIPVMLLAPYLDHKFPEDPPWRCLCGYDLCHNVSGICPECGKSLQAVKRERWRRKHNLDPWEQ